MTSVVYEVRTLWPSCDRETKLRAFEVLPKLLDKIIGQAEELAKTAEATAAKVEEMTNEELGTSENRLDNSKSQTDDNVGQGEAVARWAANSPGLKRKRKSK